MTTTGPDTRTRILTLLQDTRQRWTAGSLAQHLALPPEDIAATCRDLVHDGLVDWNVERQDRRGDPQP
jgi:predicted ArsR family transcriptional regulator